MPAARAVPKTNLCFFPSSTIVSSRLREDALPPEHLPKIPRAAFALIEVIIGERIELVRAFDVPLTLPAGGTIRALSCADQADAAWSGSARRDARLGRRIKCSGPRHSDLRPDQWFRQTRR